MRKTLKNLISLLVFSFLSASAFCQNYSIEYYGIVATEVDSNMSKMTSDLYYTQLCEIQNFTIFDKRLGLVQNTAPDSNIFSPDKLAFYTEITKNSNSDSWTVTFHVVNKKLDQELTKKREYDSFYKILMESKLTLQQTIKNLIENNSDNFSSTETTAKAASAPTPLTNQARTYSDFLSGTWRGEEHIDKIIIMRSGRGFVIFKNGASMNIELKVENTAQGQQLIVSQNGKSNASFFPELPRQLALTAAPTAEPIKWTFSITDSNTLIGKKKTLTPDKDSYAYSDINVKWERIN